MYSWLQAFASDFSDTEGKDAVSCLLHEIVNIVAPQQPIAVLPTGSASNFTFISSRIRVKRSVYSSSASQSPASMSGRDSDITYEASPTKQSIEQVSVTATVSRQLRKTRHQLSPEHESSSQSSSSSSSSFSTTTSCKTFKLSDVYVYIRKSPADPPITLLEVEIKKGLEYNPSQLIESMLGRLPYQSEIHGLYFNANEGSFWKVSKCETGNVLIEMEEKIEYICADDNQEVIMETNFSKIIDKIAEIIDFGMEDIKNQIQK